MAWLVAVVLVVGMIAIWIYLGQGRGSATAEADRTELQRWKAQASALWLVEMRHALQGHPKYRDGYNSFSVDRELDASDRVFLESCEAFARFALNETILEYLARQELERIQAGELGLELAAKSARDQFIVAYMRALTDLARRRSQMSKDDPTCERRSEKQPSKTKKATTRPPKHPSELGGIRVCPVCASLAAEAEVTCGQCGGTLASNALRLGGGAPQKEPLALRGGKGKKRRK